jgi:hypothetical protein
MPKMRTTSQRGASAAHECECFSHSGAQNGGMIEKMDYQLLFEESPDALLVLLPDSPRFTAVAATKARLLSTNSTLEQTIGRGLFELFPDNPDDETADGARRLRTAKGVGG